MQKDLKIVSGINTITLLNIRKKFKSLLLSSAAKDNVRGKSRVFKVFEVYRIFDLENYILH